MEPKIRIYVATHKKMLNPPTDPIYVPVHGGAIDCDEDWGYQRDDQCIYNLSKRNLNFCELGTMYWAWKNGEDCDITGLLHYRRWFVNDENKALSAEEIKDRLSRTDALVNGSSSDCDFSYSDKSCSIYSSYCSCHHGVDIDWADAIIKKRYPEDWAEWHKWMYHQSADCITNMIITSKEIFDDYCAWLFPIYFEMDQLKDIERYDGYNQRIYGFMGERIMYPYLRMRGIRCEGCNVGDCGNDDESHFDDIDDIHERERRLDERERELDERMRNIEDKERELESRIEQLENRM